ncbi:pyridoxamine 5'-phosphate oxidase family protein [Nonomuraea sp. KC401]|uniref:pyridoxamine 5'-phosphate oxidase family protein n=1 Tax=unclassified Nonomuraea TaxID=2593643 RepID=UPI0010FDA38D|nr:MULTISPECIES: pyridoxamine 5'-phosphate oxidase family protein [unclassified Nonomuraea]NBE99202.1 pyridoxamine 5'-phosphate oxidase family protein [Nonomuraea sp. K271]TLF57672.1 pyridoxamine 5'-phosphate oxidase family protein [Nonomuraea sp. KC401]
MLSTTSRTRLGRAKERGSTDRNDLYEVLDTALVCHLGVVVDGHPMVVPTGYGRIGDTLYLHGSTGARSLRAGDGSEVCVTVTHLDGIVLARSIFNHSFNYRSAIIYGRPRLVTDPDERMEALRALSEHLAPGQWDYARRPSRKELVATSVLALSLEEASVKIRRGAPKDEEEDYELPVWAGVVPIVTSYGEPEPDPVLPEGIATPVHVLSRE